MKSLSLAIPGGYNFNPPANIPYGGTGELSVILNTAFVLVVIAAVIICLIVLIWAGFDWIMSEGDKQKVSSARNKFAFAIIGLVVVFVSFFIINLVYGFFLNSSLSFLIGSS